MSALLQLLLSKTHPQQKQPTESMFASLSKLSRILWVIGCVLLPVIGVFHGSGINYVNGIVQESDVSQLIKSIFPVLFLFPTFQLIGMGAIGFLAVKKKTNHGILLTLSILILIYSILAFILNAVIPGLILLVPSAVFLMVTWETWKRSS